MLRLLRDESGQVIPFMLLLSVLFLGMAGLSLDLGRAYISYRELQASTDAAALAGGYALSLNGATTASVKALQALRRLACRLLFNADVKG